jgi:hypothetical protein
MVLFSQLTSTVLYMHSSADLYIILFSSAYRDILSPQLSASKFSHATGDFLAASEVYQ